MTLDELARAEAVLAPGKVRKIKNVNVFGNIQEQDNFSQHQAYVMDAIRRTNEQNWLKDRLEEIERKRWF
jgi:hypothetical protein